MNFHSDANRMTTCIELFAGAGGLALGVAGAGFKHLAIIERDAEACESLRQNRARVPLMRHWQISETDAADFDYAQFRSRVSLLTAGAPCQPFSLGGKRRGHDDERNMFPEVLRAVREIRPDAVIIENVRGLMRHTNHTYFAYILSQLENPDFPPRPEEHWTNHYRRLLDSEQGSRSPSDLRYVVKHQLLNAADYGLPQRRERVFIIAFRSDLNLQWSDLSPTHSREALLYAQWVTGEYWNEHGLSQPTAPLNLVRRIRELKGAQAPSTLRWNTVRDMLRNLPDPVEGQENTDYTLHAGIPGARTYKGHTGSPLDEPAKTIKAGGNGVPGGENMLRRQDGSVRYFTVRETARLQGFPDEYVVEGSWTAKMRQLGNAVPVDLAYVVATKVRELLMSGTLTARVA